MLIAGCTRGKVGTAIPDGDEAAEYVSAKFALTLDRLTEDILSNEPWKSIHNTSTRIDDKKSDHTITAIQAGSPPSRLFKNHSNRNSNDYRDFFRPAGSDIECILLGPLYSDLAPTSWVSKPYELSGLNNCFGVAIYRPVEYSKRSTNL